MDDLLVLHEMKPDAPLPSEADLAPARDKLAVAMRARPRRRRVVLRGLAGAGIAASIAAALIIGQSASAPPRADAEEILHRAAQAAGQQPDVVPGPNQFVYQKFTVSGDSFDTFTQEFWLSVSGMRDCDSVPLEKKEGCAPLLAPPYDPNLPTDADSMLAYLRQQDTAKYGPTGDAVNKAHRLALQYLRPKVAAALFDAVAKIPGVEFVPDAVDAAGRPGVGVAWRYAGTRDVLIFDQKTYAYLGHHTTSGEHWSNTAVLKVGVVNERGDLP